MRALENGCHSNSAYLYPCPDLHYDTRRITAFAKPCGDERRWINMKTKPRAAETHISAPSAYSLQHRVSCSPEIERRLLAILLTLYLILQIIQKKAKKKGNTSAKKWSEFLFLQHRPFKTYGCPHLYWNPHASSGSRGTPAKSPRNLWPEWSLHLAPSQKHLCGRQNKITLASPFLYAEFS